MDFRWMTKVYAIAVPLRLLCASLWHSTAICSSRIYGCRFVELNLDRMSLGAAGRPRLLPQLHFILCVGFRRYHFISNRRNATDWEQIVHGLLACVSRDTLPFSFRQEFVFFSLRKMKHANQPARIMPTASDEMRQRQCHT